MSHARVPCRQARPAGPLVGLVWLALACLLSGPAGAATLHDVRLGTHDGFTRVVLDLDASVTYAVERIQLPGGREKLELLLAAESGRHVVSTPDPRVGAIVARPASGGTRLEIELRRPGLFVQELELDSPPRVVIDVADSQAALPVWARPEPAGPGAVVRAPAPVSSGPEAEASAATGTPSAEPEAAPAAPVEPETPTVEPDATAAPAAPDATATAPSEREPVSEPEVAPQPEARAEPEVATPPEARTAAEPAPPGAPVTVVPRTQPEAEVPPVAVPVPAAVPTPDRPGLFRRLLPALGLLALAVGGVIAAVILARRPLPEPEERPVPLLMPQAQPMGRLHAAADAAREVPRPGPGSADPDDPYAPAAAAAAEEERSMQWSQMQDTIQEGSSLTEYLHGVEERVQGLESRLAQAESRVAELLEERERLARQLESHTEELRVQRAAIGRTQRVVRRLIRASGLAGSSSRTATPAAGAR